MSGFMRNALNERQFLNPGGRNGATRGLQSLPGPADFAAPFTKL
jgi:hypothetical protein